MRGPPNPPAYFSGTNVGSVSFSGPQTPSSPPMRDNHQGTVCPQFPIRTRFLRGCSMKTFPCCFFLIFFCPISPTLIPARTSPYQTPSGTFFSHLPISLVFGSFFGLVAMVHPVFLLCSVSHVCITGPDYPLSTSLPGCRRNMW